MKSRRQQRVSEMLREELSILISTELNDPRLEDALVNVTAVQVSPDLRNARVLIEHALPPTASRQVLAALEHAEGYLRQALMENLSLRFVPELHFRIDTTEERARHIDELLDAIAAERQQQEREQQRAGG
ncbi:MAG: 30S ribosome-binding factor RbfA [Anaerolineae bacterium]